MAITDTLTAIKSYFFAWHENYYDQIHKEAIDQVSEDPNDDDKIVTNKGIREYIQSKIASIKDIIGSNALNAWNGKETLIDIVNELTALQSKNISTDQWMQYKQRTTTFAYSYSARGGTITIRKQGKMCICNIRGCKIPKGLNTNTEYVLAGLPTNRDGSESDPTTLDNSSGISPFWKTNSTYIGSSSYDEVKWINIRNFDSYNPTSSYYVKTIGGNQLSKSEATSSYPRGAITFKPLDNDHERTIYATVVYWASRYPTQTDVQKVNR